MGSGRLTSVELVEFYLARIRSLNSAGPRLHAVIALNPDALAEARSSDQARKSGRPTRPLEGIPILLKDNIETADPIPTTAGSLALAGNIAGRDAPLVARLRAAGAIILGKTNLSEWANFRSSHATSGWSAVGGLTRNPYALDRTACGSSSGSAVAVAAGLAAAAIGSETDGSVTCPASMNGVVGFKPSLGLIPRTHIVPIAHSQDTAGPLAHSVADARRLASVMAGPDAADAASRSPDLRRVAEMTARGQSRRPEDRCPASRRRLSGRGAGLLRRPGPVEGGGGGAGGRQLARRSEAGRGRRARAQDRDEGGYGVLPGQHAARGRLAFAGGPDRVQPRHAGRDPAVRAGALRRVRGRARPRRPGLPRRPGGTRSVSRARRGSTASWLRTG